MVFWRDEDAVSHVTGTILLVFITVIIAAVIAQYVFGVPQNIVKTKVVAVTAQLENSGEILLIYQGGQDDQSLSSIKITAPDGTVWHPVDSAGTLTDSGSTYAKPGIGAVMKLSPCTCWPASQKHVQVVGTFTDGADQVILDTFL
jgi:FlaG/FlaF family flagellin (archaellin)